MSQIVAIWGSPNSGKTTLSVKLARYITKFRKKTVICVMTDPDTPSIPVIFANYATHEQQSIGQALSAVIYSESDIFRGSVTVEDCPELLYMGYCRGENINSYPVLYESKAREFFTVLSSLADYIIVDCVSDARDNVLSKTAMKMADKIIRLYTPDLKSLTFATGQASLYSAFEYKYLNHVCILNCNTKDSFLPVEEAYGQIDGCRCIIPYFKVLRQQMADAQLYMPVSGSRFDRAMEKIFRMVASDDEYSEEKKRKKAEKKATKKKKKETKEITV